MVRTSDVGKRMAWGQRFQRFSKWTGTVAQFCVKERVSVASFYHWRRKLQTDAARESRGLDSNGNSRKRGHSGRERAHRNSRRTDAAFLPVQVVGSAAVEVFLVEGVRLSIPVDATSALQTVVRALCAGIKSATETQDSGGRPC